MSTHKLTFYPVGNGDTSQIQLANGRRLIFDYRHLAQSEKEGAKEINLKKELRKELRDAGRDYVDVFAITHGDGDHIGGSTDFFELQHAAIYQGGDRVKINELWVPAALILEPATQEQLSNEVIIWRREARYRLKQGKGIRVFSRPDMLKSWLEENDLTVESRRHLMTDAGQLVPGLALAADGVEFFTHSPFVKHCDEGDIQRNKASLIFQVRFNVAGTVTNYLAVGDSECEVLDDIVDITEFHQRMDRLDWDLFNIPHHCSYLALGPDKGTKETKPTAGVQKLLLRGQAGAYVVSSSNPIDSDTAAYAQIQPPHVQAKQCYENYLTQIRGRKFFVTMEEPTRIGPKPLVFDIGAGGVSKALATAGAAFVSSTKPPRAGQR